MLQFRIPATRIGPCPTCIRRIADDNSQVSISDLDDAAPLYQLSSADDQRCAVLRSRKNHIVGTALKAALINQWLVSCQIRIDRGAGDTVPAILEIYSEDEELVLPVDPLEVRQLWSAQVIR